METNVQYSRESMNEMIGKAETLVEALPYIRDFNNKIVVVKYGGSAMLDKHLEESMMKDVALLKLVRNASDNRTRRRKRNKQMG